MTIAELGRAVESRNRVKLNKVREQAIMDYKLADMIGRSVGRIYSNSAKLPELANMYPTLFDSDELQETQQENKDKASVLRFKQFASSFNKKYSKEVSNE